MDVQPISHNGNIGEEDVTNNNSGPPIFIPEFVEHFSNLYKNEGAKKEDVDKQLKKRTG